MLQADGASLKKRLRDALSPTLRSEELEQVHNSYDIIGDIAIVRLAGLSAKHRQSIAQAIMKIHKNVRTVLAQASPVLGDFRTRKLEFVAGENRTATTHMESGCAFSVDVGECYFSPRLSHERMRIAKQVKANEIVINMFAGVGCFSLLIFKYSEASKVYSIDVNPVAFRLMQENIRKNRVYGRVIPLLGDAKEIIEQRLQHTADRVLMPLPEKALEYLPSALSALKEQGGWIHYYDFEHAKANENPVEKARLKVAKRLDRLDAEYEFSLGRIVRSSGPNWCQVVLDIKLG